MDGLDVLVPLAVSLGAIFLGACFAIPCAFAGAAWVRYSANGGGTDGLFWILCLAMVVTGWIGFGSYSKAVSQCNSLNAQIGYERYNYALVDSLQGFPSYHPPSLADVQFAQKKCGDLPFTDY